MLNVSERALDILENTVKSEENADQKALRLARTGQGELGIVRGDPQDDDQVIMREERPLLYVDNEVSSRLDGSTLDVVEADGRERLTLMPPA